MTKPGLEPSTFRFTKIGAISAFLTASTAREAFDSAKNHKRQRRKRQSVTAKREKSRTPKFVWVR